MATRLVPRIALLLVTLVPGSAPSPATEIDRKVESEDPCRRWLDLPSCLRWRIAKPDNCAEDPNPVPFVGRRRASTDLPTNWLVRKLPGNGVRVTRGDRRYVSGR